MPRFAIIAEGQSDQKVIENILYGYFRSWGDDLRINPIQPLGNEPGGWTRVFASLRRGDPQRAFQANHDYLIIHIDTDVQEEPGYDVPRRDGSRVLPLSEIVARVVTRLITEIDPAFYTSYQDRIIFAVAVDSIECWLLPLLYADKKGEKTTGCLNAANKALRTANRRGLSSSADNKFPDAYDLASRDFATRKVLNRHRNRNESLAIFLCHLDRIEAELTTNQASDAESLPEPDPNSETE